MRASIQWPVILALLVGLPAASFTPQFSSAATSQDAIQSDEHSFKVVTLAEGLDHPWGMAFLPDGGILITEKEGRLRLFTPDGLDPRPVEGVPRVAATGQGGLLDVALDPAFDDNRLVYLSFAAEDRSGIGTEVLRARLDGHRLRDPETLFQALPKSRGGRHFGSRLLFTPDGMLLITLGDRGQRDEAQNLSSHAGTIIRIHPDGTVPKDNPFSSRSGATAAIYTYGNRNVQGIALRAGSNQVWAHEHGPQGGDELNVIVAGTNYGWPVITYGRNYGIGTRIGEGERKEGMAQPVHYWVPSIAPSGMSFYSGEAFPRWEGDLFVGSLKFDQLVRLRLDGDRVVAEERMLDGVIGRVRDVRSGPDGLLYLLSDARRGGLFRLEPVP